MRMTSLVQGILKRTQNRILEAIDLTSVAEPTPGQLSRTLETWTGVVSRQDARNRLSLDFDMLRIQALQDLGQPGSRPAQVLAIQRDGYWAVEINGVLLRTPQRGAQRTFKTEADALKAGEKAAKSVTGVTGPSLQASLDQIAASVASVNAKAVTTITGINVRAASGLGARIDMFRDTNVSLIKSLVGSQIDDIQKLLESSEATGLQVEELRKQIEDRFGVSRSKADLLARDQTLKLNANITQARQRNAGVEKYVWTTSGDERVREEHAELEGQVFSWNDPPSIGHPGEDYQCRCTAFPVIEELDGAGED